MPRFADVARSLVGGFAVYVAMSCASAGTKYEQDEPKAVGAGGAGVAGSPGNGGASQGSNGGAIGSGGAQQAAGAPSGGSGSGAGGAGMMNPVPEAQAKSGTRLRAKVITGADGSSSVIPSVWYDSQRKEECSFVETPAGTRCLPPFGGYLGSYFGDAGCANPLGAVFSAQCSVTPKYMAKAAEACNVVRLVTLQPFSGADVYVGAPGACTKIAKPGGAMFFSGTEVNYADFVAGTTSYE